MERKYSSVARDNSSTEVMLCNIYRDTPDGNLTDVPSAPVQHDVTQVSGPIMLKCGGMEVKINSLSAKSQSLAESSLKLLIC